MFGSRDNPEQCKPFLDHLEDLRRAILWSVLFLCGGMLAAVPLAPAVLNLARLPLVKVGLDPETYLQVLHVAGGLSVALRIIFWSGLIISSPFIVLAVGAFVFPGLTPVEKGVVYRGACFAVAMFAVGVGVGYAVTLPMAVRLMLAVNRWMGVQAEFIELGDYVSFFLKLLLAFGLTFQLPVVVVALGYVGLVSSRQLRDGRRHVCVGLLVLAMILTPPDPLTQLVMALPLVALYEGCIWLVWMHERRHAGT